MCTNAETGRKKRFYRKILYYHAGEYGEKLGRPHYHACIFGIDFKDKVLIKMTNDIPLYKSDTLSRIWGKGFCSVGNVTFESAAYVARYIMKKVGGPEKKEHYERIDKETGELINLKQEYTTMSRRPGIGKTWFNKFKQDIFPNDFIVDKNGEKHRVPKYYTNMYEIENPEAMLKIKKKGKNMPSNTSKKIHQKD